MRHEYNLEGKYLSLYDEALAGFEDPVVVDEFLARAYPRPRYRFRRARLGDDVVWFGWDHSEERVFAVCSRERPAGEGGEPSLVLHDLRLANLDCFQVAYLTWIDALSAVAFERQGSRRVVPPPRPVTTGG